MANDPTDRIEDELIGEVFQWDDKGQFRATDVRESSARGTSVVFEPENPNADQLQEDLTLGQIEQMTERGELSKGVPDPRRVHESRSEYAQKQDKARDARLTTDPEQYASDPDSWDFPGVDTGPEFRERQGDVDADSFIENLFDF